MTYKTGSWGDKAKNRSKRRQEYFREYRRLHPQKYNPNSKRKKSHYEPYGTSLGFKGEILAQDYLKGAKKINRPCDYSWQGKLVDVKTAIKQKMTNKHVNGEIVKTSTYRWKFLLEKQKGKVDLFFIICKDLEDRVEYIFLIPDKDISCKNLSISEKRIEKYSKYLVALL